MASIGRLEAELLEGGGSAEQAERLSTARTLYDQAVTTGAMAEVKAIADEGLGLSSAGDSDEPAARPGHARNAKVVLRGTVASYVLLVAVICGFMFTDERPPGDDAHLSSLATEIVTELQDGPVYEAPGASGTPDSGRIRELIDHRPIVVARLDGSAGLDHDDLCEEIAEVRVTDLVIAFEVTAANRFDGGVCFGENYSDPPPSGMATEIVSDVEHATRLRPSTADGTLRAFVDAYDVAAVGAHVPDPVPKRGLTEPPPPGSTAVGPLFLIGGIPLCWRCWWHCCARRGVGGSRVGTAHTPRARLMPG